ncbi:MAG: tRNA preQ1(34) S-adenosylmethionine ribosyltransferase-isomerase QueA, partial [Vicinamibacteria bacterium]|nr:tRNA preQ1(34) S-adenosylmethionine ribosyltransferase-isomerase QueA [Vicinamibacteria bacterium]
MRLGEFDYDLPPELIAQEPLAERDASRLLVLDRQAGTIEHRFFHELHEYLRDNDLLIVNRSKVFPARLIGKRGGGGRAEVLLVKSLGDGEWDAFLRPGRRLREGSRIAIADDLAVEVLDATSGDDRQRRIRILSSQDAWTMIQRHGHMPLPPYIRRADAPLDRDRYQTVYAVEEGSVAAPTAGLHFTPELLAELTQRGIRCAEVCLHVGPGTFLPITVDDVRQHRVMPEAFYLPPETAKEIVEARSRGARIVAVGTTTTRVLEAVASEDGVLAPAFGETDLTICPGYRFRAVDAMITNFHLPRSSLLLLVCAFVGRERVLSAYREAVRLRYRFYSYGDAML